ncbi:MAG: hypothetical protein WBA66_01490 [Xanthobacteraceae bacterium]
MPYRNKLSLLAVATAALALVLPTLAVAQPAPDGENGRYTFSTTADGVLRLDTRTGQVSSCLRKAGDWACHAVPDERAALDAEIGRLVAENARLKEALAASGAGAGKIDEALPKSDRSGKGQLKPGDDQRERAQNRIEIPLPSDADIERAMSFLESVWRRLVEMASRVRNDVADRI